jgi:hypothetical protein
MTINGACFCGAVKYKVEGALGDALSCHCSMCRKTFSSAASAFARLDPDQFAWVSGENLLTTYESKTGAGIQFCSKCGSTLCGINEGKVTGMTLGCIEGDSNIEIGKHIFVGSKANWDIIPDGVPQYNEWPHENV